MAAGGLDTHVSDLINLMKKCWDENPTERPSISQVKKELLKMNGGR